MGKKKKRQGEREKKKKFYRRKKFLLMFHVHTQNFRVCTWNIHMRRNIHLSTRKFLRAKIVPGETIHCITACVEMTVQELVVLYFNLGLHYKVFKPLAQWQGADIESAGTHTHTHTSNCSIGQYDLYVATQKNGASVKDFCVVFFSALLSKQL